MNWLSATVGIIFLISIIVGIYKGAIKIAVSIGTVILTLVLVFFLTPYVNKGITTLTPLDDMIESQVVKTISNVFTSINGNGSAENGLTEDGVRSALAAAGVSEEELNAAGITIGDIVNGNITSEDLAEHGISGNILDGLHASGEKIQEALAGEEVPRDVQIAAIENSDIPEVFKSILLTNNNSEIYDELGAGTFIDYIAKYLTKLIINIVSFMLTFIIVAIILRAIIFALDIISNLPVLGLVNRLAGGVLGAMGAMLIIWALFVIVTLLYTTSIGKEIYALIQGNEFLKFLYEYNPIMKLATMLK